MSVYHSLEKYYDIIYDQAFSPNTKYLTTCDRYGKLAIFSLESALTLSSEASRKTATHTVAAHQGPAYCLQSAGNLLFSGGEDGIKGWKWSEVTKNAKDIQPILTLTPPSWQFGTPETNCLAYNEESKTLYSGCGDNVVYGWDITTGKIKATYSGHKDYVHCLCMRNNKQFVSGAEDGTVKIWDPDNQKSPVHTINTSKDGSMEWVGCVATDSDGGWLIYGGSQSPTVYNMAMLSEVIMLETPKDSVTQTIICAKDRIITGGSEPLIRHWTINGDSIASIPSSHQHAFSLAFNSNSQHYEILTVSGDSSEVQVFTNLGYRAFSMTI